MTQVADAASASVAGGAAAQWPGEQEGDAAGARGERLAAGEGEVGGGHALPVSARSLGAA